MIVRAEIESIEPRPGGTIVLKVTGAMPEPARITMEDLRTIYPRESGVPNSLSTIKRWVKDGLIKMHKMGRQRFIHPDLLPDQIAGIKRV